MGEPDNLPVVVRYPQNFEPPGPAAQAEFTLEVFETYLIDYEADYNNGIGEGLEPEEWVQLRLLYSSIHWMYNQLVGEKEGESKKAM